MGEMTYSEAGVDIAKEEAAVQSIAGLLRDTFKNRGDVLEDIGNFANLIDIGHGRAMAIATDGVGSKVLIAEKLGKYDTIGIDLVAMNVNDLICVGAEPVTMVDYIAAKNPTAKLLYEIGTGLKEGANQANISIPGGETASMPEIIAGGENAFDLAGTAVGFVDKAKIVDGEDLTEDDVLIGLESSGIHSNGLTLARKVLGMKNKEDLEAMLVPTKIYVKEILNLMNKVKVKGMAHMTGGGLKNLLRINKDFGFEITDWVEIPEVFKKIQKKGNVSDKEMYTTFNMGIGFCVVVAKKDELKALEALRGSKPWVIGKVIPGNKVVKGDLEW